MNVNHDSLNVDHVNVYAANAAGLRRILEAPVAEGHDLPVRPEELGVELEEEAQRHLFDLRMRD